MLEELQNRPETGETEDAKQDRNIDILDEQRADATRNTQDEKNRPALHTEVILALDDNRVEDSDAQKRSQPKYDAMKIHLRYPFVKSAAKVRKNTRFTKEKPK